MSKSMTKQPLICMLYTPEYNVKDVYSCLFLRHFSDESINTKIAFLMNVFKTLYNTNKQWVRHMLFAEGFFNRENRTHVYCYHIFMQGKGKITPYIDQYVKIVSVRDSYSPYIERSVVTRLTVPCRYGAIQFETNLNKCLHDVVIFSRTTICK